MATVASRFVAGLLGLVLSAMLPASALAAKRVALVIGINDYPKLKTAKDPRNGQLVRAVADAEAMAETLSALGFDVEIGRNVDRTGFLTALDRVKRKIGSGDTIFIFFAGHGVALKGSNLLLPSDIPVIDPEGEQLIRGVSIAETDIIDAVREKGAGLVILALDACRDNPIEEFAREQARIQGRAFRSVSTMRSVGLEARPTSGVFSIYSAGIGQKALDGLVTDRGERNSVFTRVFARKLREPGRHLSDIMEDVKDEVARLAATQTHLQYPAFYNETQGGRIFLAGLPKPAEIRIDPTPNAVPSAAVDEVFWSAIKDSDVPALFEEFLKLFPASPRVVEARARLSRLKGAPTVLVSPPRQPGPAIPSARTEDEALWIMIKDATATAGFEEFLRRFPTSPRAAEVRARLEQLRRGQTATVVPVAPSRLPTTSTSSEDERLWIMIKDATATAGFEEFLRKYPTSPRAAEVRARLRDLKARR